MTHTTISTLAEFDALDLRELLSGYHAAADGASEPVHSSRSYWHGWRLWMMNLGGLKPELSDRELTERLRVRREASGL